MREYLLWIAIDAFASNLLVIIVNTQVTVQVTVDAGSAVTYYTSWSDGMAYVNKTRSGLSSVFAMLLFWLKLEHMCHYVFIIIHGGSIKSSPFMTLKHTSCQHHIILCQKMVYLIHIAFTKSYWFKFQYKLT